MHGVCVSFLTWAEYIYVFILRGTGILFHYVYGTTADGHWTQWNQQQQHVQQYPKQIQSSPLGVKHPINDLHRVEDIIPEE